MIQHRRPEILVALAAAAAGFACGPPAPAVPPPLVVSDRGGAVRIYEIDREGGTARLLGSPRADDPSYRDTMPARLPDGRVAFVSDRGGRPVLHLTDAGSGEAAPLAAAGDDPGPAGAVDSDPAPLGRDRLVYSRAAAPGAARDLAVATFDGSAPRPLTRHPADDGAPCAMPDGRTVVFTSDRDGVPRLYRLDASAADPESTVAALLPDQAGTRDGDPACLPDGSVLFARAMPGQPAQLMTLGRTGQGGRLRQVTDATILPYGAGEPVPLEDGTILLTAGPIPDRGGGPDGRYAVYRIARGGYNLSRVTREGAVYSDFARGLSVP